MNILITQNHLSDFAGSEIVTLELAQHFSSLGWGVHVFTNDFGEPISSEFKKIKNVTVFTDEDSIDGVAYDIVWVHHQLLPAFLKSQLDRSKNRPAVVFNHMSPYEPYEYPRNIQLENLIADVVIANSDETKKMLELAGIKKSLIRILGNPAPDSFKRNSALKRSTKLNKVLVVSNHFPEEGMKALDQLEDLGVEVRKVGVCFGKPALVTPEMVQDADSIVTIGKTVQFALLAKTPVYIYDHFGGPGYLTPKNYTNAMLHNFSGRGFSTKKTSSEIVKELVQGFSSAQTSIDALNKDHAKSFTLSSRLHPIVEEARSKKEPVRINKDLWESMLASNFLIRRMFISSSERKNLINSERELKTSLEAELNQANLKIQELHKEINTLSLRLRRFPVGPLDRFISGALRIRWVRRYIRILRMFKSNNPDRDMLKGRLYLMYRSLPFFYKRYRIQKNPNPSILGLIRARDESLLLKDTLDHLASFVDGIVVFDDSSNDNSVQIAKKHPSVIEIIVNKKWGENRTWEETANRSVLLKYGKKYNPEWCFYSDADERFEGNIRKYLLEDCPSDVEGVRISLFDAYITPKDSAPFSRGDSLLDFRSYFGVERRDILMIWRNRKDVQYLKPDSREPTGIDEHKVVTKFFCQHYGKSLSINQWEETCHYYIDNFPQYSEKWKNRLGKAVHTESDFGTKLYKWNDVKKRGVKI